MSDGTPRGHLLVAGEGDTAHFFADEIVLKEQRAEFDLSVVVLHVGCEPPLHVHQREDEWFYVLEGAITAFVAGDELAVDAGDLVFLPKGVPHTYAVDTGVARLLVVNSPGGFARMFADIVAAFGGEMPTAPGPEAGELMGPVFDAYGIVMAGPNPRHAERRAT
jgi:quercetin dioxygenase-like cupin family protein